MIRYVEARARLARPLGDFVGTIFADRRFTIFLLLTFLGGLAAGPFLPFLPIYVKEQLGLHQTFAANFRTISLFLMALFVLLGGVASDSLGPKSAVLMGLLGIPLAALVFTIDIPWLLLVIAVGSGIADGFITWGGQAYMVQAAPAGRLATATAAYFMGSTLGGAAGSAIGGAVLEASSYRLLGLIMFLAVLPVMVGMVFLLPNMRPEHKERRSALQTLSGYRRIAGRRHVWSLATMQYLRTTFWGAASLAMPFLIKQLTDSDFTVGMFASASLVCGMIAMVVMGTISDRVGRRKIILGSLAAIGVSSGLLALSTGSAPAFFVAGIVATTAAWTLSGQVTPLAKEIAAPGEAGRLVGMILFPWALGMLTGAQIHGLLTESNPALMFGLMTGLLVASMGFAEYMYRHSPSVGGDASGGAAPA